MAAAGWGLWFAAHLLVAAAGTWLAREYALRHQLLDQPGERRAHSVATPRGGGIAIVAALLLAIGWLMSRQAAPAGVLGAIATGLVLVAGIGWIDDHRPLPPTWRLCVHAVAAAALAWGVHASGGGVLLAACSFGFALVLVNVWNFMDGIDGLATSQALLVALAAMLLAGGGAVAWLALALAAACAGFLPFNLPKARIFLGDVGSGALGYALAALVALSGLQGAERALLLLFPLSAFMVDASLTLAARMVRRERWWLPHAEHAYQCWTRRKGRHGVVTVAYAGWTLAATAAMLSAAGMLPAFMMVVLAGVYLAGTIAWTRLRESSRGWGSRE